MNIIVFDTETVGKQSQALLNVGYKIVDLNPRTTSYKVLCERNYLENSLFANEMLMINDDFVGIEKFNKYKKLVDNKQIIKHNIAKILDLTAKDIIKHKVMFGYAYNCNFDIDKITKTASQLGVKNPLEDLPIFDIWAYAQNFIVDTPAYISWAKDNEMFTDSGIYIKSSVESVVAYLQNNVNFVEEHTALSDVQHELNILIECLKLGCDITRAMPRGRFIPSGKQNLGVATIDGKKVEFSFSRTRTIKGVVHYS